MTLIQNFKKSLQDKKSPVLFSIIGLPGSGKGTQAKFIAKKYKVKHIEIGDLVRKYIRGNPIAKEKYIKGIPQPSPTINKIIKQIIEKCLSNNCDRILLDPYPLKIKEVNYINKISKKYKLPLNIMLYLETDEDEVYNRILKRSKIEGRADDKSAVILKRIKRYRKELNPIINYYKKQKRIIKINGNASIRQVNKNLIEKLR